MSDNNPARTASSDAGEDPIFQLARAPVTDSTSGPYVLPEDHLRLLLAVRNANRAMFRAIDSDAAPFEVKAWNKAAPGEAPQGGGVMTLLRGQSLEKAAVNMSVVWGPKYPALEGEHAGKPFLAAGVSLICHPRNPNAPIAHMNVRLLTVGEAGSGDRVMWMGGGADLTPMVRFPEDTELFHTSLREACEASPIADYERYKAWCDEYFFIPHRGETRGVGGIFFDYLKPDAPTDVSLLLEVGTRFARAYETILRRRIGMPYDDALALQHQYWRGRYAEFNLVYDRGTRFGLLSGGNIEAIFASLPPLVRW